MAARLKYDRPMKLVGIRLPVDAIAVLAAEPGGLTHQIRAAVIDRACYVMMDQALTRKKP